MTKEVDKKEDEVIEFPKIDLDKPEVHDEVDETQTPEFTEEETIALARGWQTKEDWVAAGKAEEDWKPAKVFNEIGALKEKLQEREKEAKKLNKVVSLMKEHHLNVRQAAYEQAMKDLKAQRAAALEQEDFAKAEKLRDRMDEVKEKFEDAGKLPAAVEKEIQEMESTPDPEFFAFAERNPWYVPGGKNEMSAKADAIGQAYHLQHPEWDFKTLIKHVEEDIRKLFPEKFKTPPRQVVNEPGARTAPSKPKNEVKLSEAELAVAKSFGMTPEEYAKELQSYKGR